MKQMTLHEKAVRLCEGGVVEFEGHFVRAVRYEGNFLSCPDCKMDSICSMEMSNLCAECDDYEGCQHILVLSNKKRLKV